MNRTNWLSVQRSAVSGDEDEHCLEMTMVDIQHTTVQAHKMLRKLKSQFMATKLTNSQTAE